MVKNIISFLTS